MTAKNKWLLLLNKNKKYKTMQLNVENITIVVKHLYLNQISVTDNS